MINERTIVRNNNIYGSSINKNASKIVLTDMLDQCEWLVTKYCLDMRCNVM